MSDFEFNQPFSCHIETTGSHWYFNGATRMYIRIPKEGHREDPAWGNTPGALQDNFWHKYDSMRVNVYNVNAFCDVEPTCCPHLEILVEGVVVATPPNAKIISITNREGVTI
jgi:hypothetical protein